MNTFKTLLLREWMQHHKGWLAVMIAPIVLILGVYVFSKLAKVEVGQTPMNVPSVLMVGSVLAVTFMVFAITWTVTVMQAPGMARRDHQDRSVEFWASLPVSHTASVAAMVLMQLLLIPLLGLLVGYVGSLLVGVVGVAVTSGLSGFGEVPWSGILSGSLATLAYMVLGITLSMLWLSPIVLVAMAASAWLKRWGVPALVAGLAGSDVLLDKFYGITLIGDTLKGVWVNALYSIVHKGHPIVAQSNQPVADLNHWPVDAAQLVEGVGMSLANLAQPLFLFVLVTAAAAFAALVLRRSRG
ncbi:hypothetical protein [Piscinibacter terrae]|uniref:Uncharacterized protein n=1 Tax=Piscinibacter terrae TaxID=2496871 RepID=A0A3N7HY60_9BURK|nr:hypothetical protein [Albitalea terrae]RQP26001.1 hypothetical protein DZC73_02810 [Albitalea terrae]